ncbi:MAG TPA: carboxypeptidase-like regulatory domain-containing protein [Candidatus Acidoferrales bacterium]|nr:carboxypeptidase-like regulatory domain-containing protein [Candidatus Acidoferrales bacterium]
MRLRSKVIWRFVARNVPWILTVAALVVVVGTGRPSIVLANGHSQSDSKKDEAPPTTKIKIEVTDPNDKPVSQASVYVRFNESGGVFHKDKLAELDLKTNQDGSTKVPPIPQGKIMIQVVAKGWRTFGSWYDIESAEQTVQIKLQARPHWY